MPERRKVCVVVASRANYARIKTVLAGVEAHPELELQIVAGASLVLERFGNAVDVMAMDGFTPDATIRFIIEGETPVTMAKSTGLGAAGATDGVRAAPRPTSSSRSPIASRRSRPRSLPRT